MENKCSVLMIDDEQNLCKLVAKSFRNLVFIRTRHILEEKESKWLKRWISMW